MNLASKLLVIVSCALLANCGGIPPARVVVYDSAKNPIAVVNPTDLEAKDGELPTLDKTSTWKDFASFAARIGFRVALTALDKKEK